MAVPSEFKYSKEHEWVKIENNVATIGITEYAQKELEDSPEFVNESPYEKAWMVKIEISDDSQLEELLSADQYSEMIGE